MVSTMNKLMEPTTRSEIRQPNSSLTSDTITPPQTSFRSDPGATLVSSD